MKDGRIVKALSGFYYVQSDDHIYACKGRGVFRKQKVTPLVGDFVTFTVTNDMEGYITNVKQRKNELVRPPIVNVTQAVIVMSATNPTFSPLLLDRFLTLVESKQIRPMIIITKRDLLNENEETEVNEYIVCYNEIGYPVHFVSLMNNNDLTPVIQFFKDEVTVLMGQSGVGKSTLLNAINPNFNIETQEISTSLGRGRHTTRHVELWSVHGGLVADTPGFSSLDFDHIEAEQLSNYFIEMKRVSHLCKFRRCLHRKEPRCAVKKAVEKGTIKTFRYDHYKQFLQEIMDRKPRYSND